MPCPEVLRSQKSWSAFNINLYAMDAFNIHVCSVVSDSSQRYGL